MTDENEILREPVVHSIALTWHERHTLMLALGLATAHTDMPELKKKIFDLANKIAQQRPGRG